MGCINVEYFAGESFSNIINDMRRLMNILNCSIRTSMNGISVTVLGDKMDVDDAVKEIKNRIGSSYNPDQFFIIR